MRGQSQFWNKWEKVKEWLEKIIYLLLAFLWTSMAWLFVYWYSFSLSRVYCSTGLSPTKWYKIRSKYDLLYSVNNKLNKYLRSEPNNMPICLYLSLFTLVCVSNDICLWSFVCVNSFSYINNYVSFLFFLLLILLY